MANDITSRLTVDGDPAEVQKLFAAIHGGTDDYGNPIYMDFNKIIPMPESLDIESGSRTDTGLALYMLATQGMGNARIERWTFDRIKRDLEQAECSFTDAGIRRFIGTEEGAELYSLGRTAAENLANYGAKTWYEWCNRTWGTKWNAYEQRQISDNAIEFQTAWAGVPHMIEKLSEQFPALTFSYMYADEDWGCNVGEYRFENGMCVDVNLPENESENAQFIAEELLGPSWEDEQEDEDEVEIEV